MPTEQYVAKLSIQDVLANLNKLDKANEKTWKKAERDANAAIKGIISGHNKLLSLTNKLDKGLSAPFKNVGGSAQLSGVQIGAMAGVVTTLTQQFIQLGQQAIGVLVDIGKQSIETAIEIDTLKARLGGIFDGNKEAADQAFTFIQGKSKELGINLSELAGAFIPKTESLAQFERVAKLATALARSDPEQGAIGARIALIEALSGTFISLQRRFEIPKSDINAIKEAFNKEGIEGFISTLETTLAKSGKSFEDLENTASTAFARLDIAGKQIGGRLGVPIVESLERASNKILDFIDANEDDLIVFADTIGRAIGDAIDFLSSIDLSQFDTGQLVELSDSIFKIIQSIQLVVPQIATFVTGFSTLASNLPVVSQTLDGLGIILGGVDEAFITLVQIIALANAELAAFEAASNKAAIGLDLVQAGLASASLNYGEVITQLQEAQSKLNDNKDAQKAYNESISASAQQFEDYKNAIEGNKTAQDDLRTSLDEAANAGTGAADAAQALARAQDAAAASASDLADAEAEAADKTAQATDKFNEGAEDAGIDLQRKLADVEKEGTRKRLDAAAEFAQKRVDLALKNQQAIDDIELKNQQAVADAGTDLERNEQDIATKFARENIKQAKDEATKQVDIEKDLRRQIADIRKQFNRDAEEAERSRDAVGFLAALRKRNQEITDAQADRNRKTQDARVEGQTRREELKLQQQQEIEDAQLANERKLEDLRLALQRDLEAQAINFQQEQDALAVAEQRKNEELKLWQERAIEDANTAHSRKLEDLQLALDRELEAITAHVDAAAAEYARLAEAAANAASASPLPGANSTTRQGNINEARQSAAPASSRQGGINSKRQRGRAIGGPVMARSPYVVGERGPELFVPGQAGRVMSNQQLQRMAMPFVGGGGSTTNNSKQINLSIPPDKLSPGQRAEARQLALEVLDGTS